MSFIREWAGTKLVYAYPDGIPDCKKLVSGWSIAGCLAFLSGQSKLHRFLVGLDMAFGQWGTDSARTQDSTISSRTALDCLNLQTAGTWALLLGACLEELDPGHLQAAITADYCRARLEYYS
jgi:hypothetical protein